MPLAKFQRNFGGQSVYVCRICKHNTRNVGGDEGDLKLCLPCYDLAGLENLQSDGGDLEPYRAEIMRHLAQIEARGKGDAGWRDTFKGFLETAAA